MDALKVYVVDDEEGMRLGVGRVLRDFVVNVPNEGRQIGLDVELCQTGQQFLDALAERPADIVLLDYRLPDMTGADILERMGAREDDETLVIVVTAYASIETALLTVKRGAYDFLAKPFTPEELTNVLSKAAVHLLLQRQARLLSEERRRVRFEFISVLAHELKAPLNAVEGYMQLMKARTGGESIADYERMIERSLIRIGGMRKLIFDLLDLTRIESGQKKRTLKPVDMVALMADIVEGQAFRAEETNVDVHVRMPDELVFDADPDELSILLGNLVSNAIKYNKSGGRVDVTVSATDSGGVKAVVADTGIGMTPENAKTIFEDFVRIKDAKTRHVEGSGLGLSTVKKIAALYDGDVTVESEPDVGSTFTAVLNPARAQGSE